MTSSRGKSDLEGAAPVLYMCDSGRWNPKTTFKDFLE
jgi:hypothetical protein